MKTYNKIAFLKRLMQTPEEYTASVIHGYEKMTTILAAVSQLFILIKLYFVKGNTYLIVSFIFQIKHHFI